MRLIPRFGLAALLVFSVSACSNSAPGTQNSPAADVRINWTFAGQTCAAAGVATIELDIAGHLFTPNQFACLGDAGTPDTGIDLDSLPLGQYQVELRGLDQSSSPLYLGGQSIDVVASASGDVFNIDAQSFASGNLDGGATAAGGTLVLQWNFEGKDCAQAGVASVQVEIDGQPVTGDDGTPALPCSQGSVEGVTIAPLAAGSHSLSLSASAPNQVIYSASAETQIAANLISTKPVMLQLPGSALQLASAVFSWSFVGMGCEDALVDTVNLTLDGNSFGTFPCLIDGESQITIYGITPGEYTPGLSAYRAGASGAELVYQTAATSSRWELSAGGLAMLGLDGVATGAGVGGVVLTVQYPDGPDCANTHGSGNSYQYVFTNGLGMTTSPAVFLCGGASGGDTITVCLPGSTGCPAGSPGMTAGGWFLSTSYDNFASMQLFFVPNAAVDTASASFEGGPGP